MEHTEFRITFDPDVFTKFNEEQLEYQENFHKGKVEEVKSNWIAFLILSFLSGILAQTLEIPWWFFWVVGLMMIMPFSYRRWLGYRDWKKQKKQLIKEGQEWIEKCDEVMLYRFIFTDDDIFLYEDEIEHHFKWDDFDSYISAEQLVKVWGQVPQNSFMLLRKGMDEDDFLAIQAIIDEKMEGKTKYTYATD